MAALDKIISGSPSDGTLQKLDDKWLVPVFKGDPSSVPYITSRISRSDGRGAHREAVPAKVRAATAHALRRGSATRPHDRCRASLIAVLFFPTAIPGIVHGVKPAGTCARTGTCEADGSRRARPPWFWMKIGIALTAWSHPVRGDHHLPWNGWRRSTGSSSTGT